ncbi:MAG: c-type cytochrome [Pirellulaceae bacterium]
MPATEQTWRNQKLLNHVFAATGVLLLFSTIWMLVKDHNREWKGYQQNTRTVELTRNQWEQEQARVRLETLQAELEASALETQSQPIPDDLLEKFKTEVQADQQWWADWEKRQPLQYDFNNIDSLFKQYNELADKATKQRMEADKLRQQAEAAEKEATAAKLAAQQAEEKIDGAQDADAAAAEAENKREFADKADNNHKQLDQKADQADAAATTDEHAAAAKRQALLDAMRSIMQAARFLEDSKLGERKFVSANLDASKARLDIAVRDGASEQTKEELQKKVDELKQHVSDLTLQYEHAAAHRAELDETIDAITAESDAADKQLAEARAELEQLQKAAEDQRSTWFVGFLPGKKWLELPILDAFQSPLKIDNKWHEGNTIDYNFTRVRRFDRCTTCHQSIDKTQTGSAITRAYVGEKTFELVMRTPTPEQLKEFTGDDAPTIEAAYGFRVADRGLLEYDAVTVSFVRPASEQTPQSTLAAQARIASDQHLELTGEEIRRRLLEATGDVKQSPAERPGLMAGDIIEFVGKEQVNNSTDLRKYLLDSVAWGEPVRLKVRRGLPEPYTTHPRMDLFVGSLSPHNEATFACTICHEGQGSATDFKWASHSPNTPKQGKEWAQEYGWFDNHHWIYPMYPERFSESSCIKCHHQVTELEGQLITADGGRPADRFLEEPAPKLMHGYNLVRKYGCFGCHEVNGYGADRTVGPDLRLEPTVSEAAQQIMSDPGFEKLTDEQQSWAEQLKFHPERNTIRRRLLEAIQADQEVAKQGEAKLSPVSHKVGALLSDVESPGEMRKVGPSLRRVEHKLTSEFMFDWVRQPGHFRPDTRMPQFFGLWDHLTIEDRLHALEGHGDHGAGDAGKDAEHEKHQDVAMRYEPVEILGVVTYLRGSSQSYEYAQPAEAAGERSQQERISNGKLQFENRGCLACHTHKDFPDADKYRPKREIVQGPDLSAISEKFDKERNPNGRKWLYSWIHNPSSYNPRTFMPDLQLKPYDEPVMDTTKTPAEPKKDADGKPVTRRIDPISDIVDYLMADSHSDWQPILGESVEAKGDELVLDKAGEETLNEIVRKNLEDAFSRQAAENYAKDGIPEEMRGDIRGAEIELVGDSIDDQKKLMYVGRKVIARYGCYGCHDIPGFEDSKPIGTGLADWGRKDPSRLAFEHITHYIDEKHRLAKLEAKSSGQEGAGHGAASNGAASNGQVANGATAEHAADHESGAFTEQDYLFYDKAIRSGHRSGFIWQKLLEPRSYDFAKTENKKYSERLRMPEFPFSDAEREAVITFVLGLVADPPDPLYIYQPSPRQESILAGRRVAEKYNCNGCHMFELEKWDIAFAPDTFGEQLSVQTFPFMNAHFLQTALEDSAKVDRRGLRHALLVGLPTIADADALPVVNDFEGDPLSDDDQYDPATVEYLFDLWRPMALDGHPYQTAVLPLRVTDDMIERKTAARGGNLAKYLVSRVIAQARAAGKQVKGTEAWGWVPPPLVGEGEKVQTDWLHDFLLDPHMIRPEVVLRMPKFNMSPDEASALVDYFAAKDEVSYPYNFSPRRRQDYLKEQQQGYQALLEKLELPESTRFEDARKIVFNKAGCIQCHAVADYNVSPRGPDLAEVYKRLRGEYTQRWIANPKRILPYTSMPENFKYNPENPQEAGFVATFEEGGETKKQHLVHGTATEQLDAMVDLLMNFDLDARQRSPYAPLVQQNAAPMEGEAGGDTSADSGANSGGSE